MFDRIAGVYDRMNGAMTAGLDERWRARSADLVRLIPGEAALDVCCGTGDLALQLAHRVGPSGRVVGCDFSERMLELARRKGRAAAIAEPEALCEPRFESADALALPYPDGEFDAVTVGFGARNLADLDLGLREMARVLRPGGRLAILEITQPQRQPLASFFSIWFDRIVPRLGVLAGEDAAYSYLPESVKRFPLPADLAVRIDAAGFGAIRWSILAGGIIAIHSAELPAATV